MSGFGREFWQQHHKAWKTSGLHRITYCEEHGLPTRNFRRWSARFEPHSATHDRPAPERPVPADMAGGEWRDVSSLSLEGSRPAMMAQLLSARAFRRRKWTEAERQDVVWDLLQSGMSTWQYAKVHNLTPSMLYRWLRELAAPIPGRHQPSAAVDPAPVFATVQLAPPGTQDLPPALSITPAPDAVPVQENPSPSGDMQIGLPNGAFLRVPVTIDPVTLRGILDVLATMR